MGTSSGELAIAAVDALAAGGIEFAFLHHEAEVAAGAISSDIDLVAASPPDQVIAAASIAWARVGLQLVMVSEYDISCTALWLTTRTASECVQLDLAHDQRARNRFHVSTDWLGDVRLGDRWPVIAPELSKCYRKTKLDVKAAGRRPDLRDTARAVRRLRRPVGFWAHIRAVQAVAPVSSRFARFLPEVQSYPLERRHGVWGQWPPLSVIAILKPTLLITHGLFRPAAAGVIVDDEDVDGAATQIVDAMSRRLEQRSSRRSR